jgi:hypothetical protein
VFENSVVVGTGPSTRAFSISSPADEVSIRSETLVEPDGKTGSTPQSHAADGCAGDDECRPGDSDMIIDYAGAARPRPVGTAADAGAFEVE